jgi:uncharacterized membrane protein
MINCILGLWTLGSIEILVIFLMPVVLIIVLLRWFIRNKKENIRLRLEVGKLADEIEKMRKQKSSGLEDSVNKSD